MVKRDLISVRWEIRTPAGDTYVAPGRAAAHEIVRKYFQPGCTVVRVSRYRPAPRARLGPWIKGASWSPGRPIWARYYDDHRVPARIAAIAYEDNWEIYKDGDSEPCDWGNHGGINGAYEQLCRRGLA